MDHNETMYETLQLIGWIGNIICLVGAYRIAQQKRDGYMIFAIACLFLLPPVIYGHVWNQVALEVAYIAIDVMGWLNWGRNKHV
jgi:Nicotinamide mononucleotide transporter